MTADKQTPAQEPPAPFLVFGRKAGCNFERPFQTRREAQGEAARLRASGWEADVYEKI